MYVNIYINTYTIYLYNHIYKFKHIVLLHYCYISYIITIIAFVS